MSINCFPTVLRVLTLTKQLLGTLRFACLTARLRPNIYVGSCVNKEWCGQKYGRHTRKFPLYNMFYHIIIIAIWTLDFWPVANLNFVTSDTNSNLSIHLFLARRTSLNPVDSHSSIFLRKRSTSALSTWYLHTILSGKFCSFILYTFLHKLLSRFLIANSITFCNFKSK